MASFLLLHGAWHGGWCWRNVAARLRADRHTVITPTFTGVSDRAHLLSPLVDLSTHIEDVVRLIDAEDARDVVLVGHSYAGMVAAGVADRRPGAIRTRVHLDAFVPHDGEAAIDLLPEPVAAHYRESVESSGFGWLIPPRPLAALGVTAPDQLAWLAPRLTPQPWATYSEALRLEGDAHGVPGVFVECVSWTRVFAPHAARARAAGWPVHELATGHEAMVTAPEALAAVLAEVVTQGGTRD